MSLLPRFPDTATERAFLVGERMERGVAIRALIAISIATLLSYIVLNPNHLPPEGVRDYALSAGTLMVALAGFFVLTRTRFYLETPWIDLPIFVVMAAGMKWLALVLAAQAATTGIPPHAMAMIQMAILVIFASIGFAGTFAYFLGWAVAVLGLFAAWLMTLPGVPDISRMYTLTNFSTFFVFALYFNWDIERRARKVFAATQALEAERAKTEELLYNVLPQEVAARLRAGEAVADAFSDLTAVFVDLAGSSALARKLSPGHLVKVLNHFFSAADFCAERHGLEKVKTIGDAYLAVAGGTASNGRDSEAAVLFARDLIARLKAISDESGIALRVRIGIHTGPAVGGVIGSSRLAYDYWGDTMNVAARLQGVAPMNGVAVSEATYFQARTHEDFVEQSLVLKGIGQTSVYVAVLDDEADGSPAE
ncbi:MAG TPA: adenylate/guanylate cyclase domain-containing protein [Allosphingosinicella sp.]